MYEYYKIASTAKWSGTEYDPWRRFIGPLIYSACRPVSEKICRSFHKLCYPITDHLIQLLPSHLICLFQSLLSLSVPYHQIKTDILQTGADTKKKCHECNMQQKGTSQHTHVAVKVQSERIARDICPKQTQKQPGFMNVCPPFHVSFFSLNTVDWAILEKKLKSNRRRETAVIW